MRRFLTRDRAADLLLWLAVGPPVVLSDDLAPAGLPEWPFELAAMAVLGLAVAVSRRHPVVAAAVAVALQPLANVAAGDEMTFLVQGLLFAFLLGRRTPAMRTGLVVFGAACLTWLVVALLQPGATLTDWLTTIAILLVTIMLPFLVGRYIRQHDQLVRTGWELAERLEREQDLIGERMRLVERSRIAGDMHDTLGHELSLIALRAAALQVDPGMDEHARTAAGELRQSTARATEHLRETIRVLRDDDQAPPVLPATDTVAALVERAVGSGVAVTLAGDLPPLPPLADRAASRVVQEALTNATKHAPGAAVTVRLGTDPDSSEAIITVTNAPAVAAAPGALGGGQGLIGLDERVRLAGGRVQAGPVDGGFELTARLPTDRGAAATPRDSAREYARARKRVRRSLLDAIWLPVAASAAILLASFGYTYYTASGSVLDAAVYEDLRIGETQSTVESRLPRYQAEDGQRPEGAPEDPPGTDECRIYRTTALALSPAYRLCFSQSVLSHKDQVTITQE